MSEVTPIPKTKADDYLKEFGAQDREQWMSPLLDRIISIRAVPDNTFLDTIYEDFLITHGLSDAKEKSTDIKTPTPVIARPLTANNGFELKNLVHEDGVNALVKGATLSFHSRLTVIYGKNGSGKSGFVRILKRISASRTQEDIWQNINNSKKKNECKVKIVFNNGTDRTVMWDGHNTLTPFNRMSIFDGECIPIYLTEGLDFSYQPYGFELFQSASRALTGLQQRMTNHIQKAEDDKPPLEGIFNSGTTIGKFINSIGPSTKVADLNKLPQWGQSAKEALLANIKESKSLQNMDLQFENLQTRLQKVTALQEKLEEIKTETSPASVRTYLQLIKKFNISKKKFTEKKGKTLDDYKIPEMASDEWEKFIEAGESYTDIAYHENYPEEADNCIYCQQKLSKTATKLIQLYRKLFEEEESNDFEDIENELDEALSNLEDISFSNNFPYKKNDFVKILTKKLAHSSFDAMDNADALIQQVIGCLNTKKAGKLKPLNISGLITSTGLVKAKIENDIKQLNEAQRNFNRRSVELNLAEVEMKDIQKFSKYKRHVEKYIGINQWIAKASSLAVKFNTRPITELGMKAWKELVSDSFKRQFNTEVASLDAPNVNLNFRGEYGSQMREKSLSGMDHINQFLSEGEQKAVALSDFFAELAMQGEKTPVIFDDPATSFDHDRKEKIAKRIVKESESRQVIVFTHDLMFANYLHEQVEKENHEVDSIKAAFHKVEKNDIDAGVVTENDYAGSINFNAQVQKVDGMFTSLSSLSGESKRDGIRTAYSNLRKAIEKAVEEKIFGKVVTRWSEQIQMRNIPRATLNKSKLEKAKELHEEFSRYIDAHDQSNEMIQHAMPDNIEKLKKDIQEVKNLIT